MGLCNKRFFLLTLCTIQLITTVERQVFDFLGFMWVPILVNFFNIIFVILGFFGAFQYQPKYIVSYCIWNALWLVWNIFVTCFYLSVGVLDKNSDLLNLGTGSFSWWQVNGPGCRAHYNDTVSDRLDVERPDLVTGCILDYEIIEVLHSSAQCLLAVMAVIGGIMLSRVFMEEDDSFDFVGGENFGTAGHTPLHPMYVSYSALSPPKTNVGSAVGSRESYYYPTNTGTTTASDSQQSTPATTLANSSNLRSSQNQMKQSQSKDQRRLNVNIPTVIDYDYSNPIDQLPTNNNQHRNDYDTLELRTPPPLRHNNRQFHYQRNIRAAPAPPLPYSPLMGHRQFNRAAHLSPGNSRSNRSSFRPRLHADHIREQQNQSRLRSFRSDPRLAVEQEQNSVNANQISRGDERRRDNRPISMYINNY